MGSREFEVPEIKLLVDSIAANRSLSREKKEKMIGKLLSLLSVHQAEKIEKHLHYGNDDGSLSEQLYYSIDKITDAINENRKIEFMYGRRVSASGMLPKDRLKRVIMTPVLIRSNNDHYYVCGFSGDDDKSSVFRIDHMIRTRVLEEQGRPHPDMQKVERFLNSLFDMETGEMTDVTLECRDEISEVIGERFGQDADIWRSTQDSFYIKVPVSVSPAFYSWVFRFGGMVRIVSPAPVRDAYVKMAADVVRLSGRRY